MKNIALPAVDFKPKKKDGRIVTSDINKKTTSDVLNASFEYTNPLNMGLVCDIYSERIENLDPLDPKSLPIKEMSKKGILDDTSFKITVGADIFENYTESIFYKFQRYLDLKI